MRGPIKRPVVEEVHFDLVRVGRILANRLGFLINILVEARPPAFGGLLSGYLQRASLSRAGCICMAPSGGRVVPRVIATPSTATLRYNSLQSGLLAIMHDLGAVACMEEVFYRCISSFCG